MSEGYERIMLDVRLGFSDGALADASFMDNAFVVSLLPPEKMQAVMIPAAVPHPAPQKKVFFPELVRGIRPAVFEEPPNGCGETRCGPLVRVDVEAPVHCRLFDTEVSFRAKTVTV